jgi:hypothetical protein
MAMSPRQMMEREMKVNRKFMLRVSMLAAGCVGCAAAAVLLARGQLPTGFFLGFAGLSAVAVAETDIDPGARFTGRSLAGSVRGEHSPITTLGSLCGVASWFCLAAALISWVALP